MHVTLVSCMVFVFGNYETGCSVCETGWLRSCWQLKMSDTLDAHDVVSCLDFANDGLHVN